MVLILVDSITPRVSYTFDFIFKTRGVAYELTTDLHSFDQYNESRLNYSANYKNEAILQIEPSSLLFEKGVLNHSIEKSNYHDEECLMIDSVSDPIATVFFLLSRYEEYSKDCKDKYGRYPFSESILCKFNWIEKAIADRCAIAILKNLGEYKAVETVSIIPTFDIDNVYAYKLKKGRRAILGIGKDLFNFNFSRIIERIKVMNGGRDPFDTYEIIKKVGEDFPLTKVFWLVGLLGEKDRNVSIGNLEHQRLIKEISHYASVNLHPSYGSFNDGSKILKEKNSLEEVLGKKVDASRQHFLRFQVSQTYSFLEEMGFKNEYSMGFAERAGFRSGTARSFLWYDLINEQVSTLILHPFVYMDGTLHEYMKLTIEQSKLLVKRLFDEVSSTGGDFVFIWHNETIGNYGKWQGWEEVFNFTLELKDE